MGCFRVKAGKAAPVLLCAALIIFVAASCGSGAETPSEDSGKSWDYERFDSDITVHGDGSFTVRETQVIDFRGGFSFITRDLSSLPARDVTEGRTYGKVRITDIEVFDLDGSPYDPAMWEVDSYQGGKTVRIRFQARDEQRGWIISYRMKGAFIYAEAYDRLYWNAVPYYRDVPIAASRVTVTLPTAADMREVRFTDYFSSSYPGSSIESGRDGDTVWWEAEGIGPYQNLTIDVAVPKGVIDKPSPYRVTTMWLMLGLALAILLGTLLCMLALWWLRGRDAHAGPAPGVSYEPPRELKPAVLGMLVYQQPRVGDMGATVVDLAVRGKLKIIRKEGEGPGEGSFSFERRDKGTKDLLPYERVVMNGLFKEGDKVTENDVRLGEKLVSFLRGVRKEAQKEKLFHDDPESTVGRYFRAGLCMLFVPPLVLFILHYRMDLGYAWLLLAGSVPAGILVWTIGRAMPRRTARGARLFRQALGFKEYLRTAEAGEAESMTAENFQENLSYAMVFGMADRWARLFTGILAASPDWYAGPESGFNAVSIASNLDSMSHVVYGFGPSAASSGGGHGFSGGSVGGGFGGGSSGGGFGGGGSSAG